MKIFPLLILVAFFSSVCGYSATAGGARSTPFCRVDEKSDWREYQTAKAIPEIAPDNGGAYAEVWAAPRGGLLVVLTEPGDDFWIYTDYCFDLSGRLVRLRYEFRTAWGWGYREEDSVSKSKLNPVTSEFFSIDQRISRPEMADEPSWFKP